MNQTEKLRNSISQIKQYLNQGKTLGTIARLMNYDFFNFA
jgi:hypothetical protein